MKKMIALLTTVMILAGSVGMTSAAAGDSSVCRHTDIMMEADYVYTTTSTHPVWVANKPNGEPIFATCTYIVKWQHYRYVCSYCNEERGTKSVEISEAHSMHH